MFSNAVHYTYHSAKRWELGHLAQKDEAAIAEVSAKMLSLAMERRELHGDQKEKIARIRSEYGAVLRAIRNAENCALSEKEKTKPVF